MLVQTQTRKTISGVEGMEVARGSIREENVGMLFTHIADNLYSDKISSVCREHIANAFDANRANNQEQSPIEIHLPTMLDPYLRIKDSGLGLSFDGIKNYYISAGASTKRENIEDIGGYGLGAKNWIAYTDAVVVVSVNGGFKLNVSLQRNEVGEIVAVPISKTETSESSGLMIEIPVALDDIAEFRQKAFYATKFLNVKPNFVNENGEYNAPKIIHDEGSWFLVEGSDSYNHSTRALVGFVPYEISSNSMGVYASELRDILDCGTLYFRFGPSDLAVSLSREQLAYKPATIEKIRERCAIVKSRIHDMIKEKIDTFPDIIQAISFVKKMKEDFSFANIKLSEIQYKGIPLYTDTRKRFEILDDNKCVTATFYPEVYKFKSSDKPSRIKGESQINIIDPETCVVIYDLPSRTGIAQRLASLEDKGFGEFLVMDSSLAYFKDFWNLHGFDYLPTNRVFKASTLERVGMAVRGPMAERRKKTKVMSLYMSCGYSRAISYYWRNNDYELPENNEVKYYIPTKGYSVFGKDKYASKNYLSYISQVAGSLGLTVYGVRQSDVKKLDSTWVPVEEGVQKAIEGFIDKNEDNIHKRSSYYEIDSNSRWIKRHYEVLGESHQIRKIAKSIEEVSNWNDSTYDRISSVINEGALFYCNGKFKERIKKILEKPVQLLEEVKNLGQKYPLLQFVHSADEESIRHYVNLVDKTEEKA